MLVVLADSSLLPDGMRREKLSKIKIETRNTFEPRVASSW